MNERERGSRVWRGLLNSICRSFVVYRPPKGVRGRFGARLELSINGRYESQIVSTARGVNASPRASRKMHSREIDGRSGRQSDIPQTVYSIKIEIR